MSRLSNEIPVVICLTCCCRQITSRKSSNPTLRLPLLKRGGVQGTWASGYCSDRCPAMIDNAIKLLTGRCGLDKGRFRHFNPSRERDSSGLSSVLKLSDQNVSQPRCRTWSAEGADLAQLSLWRQDNKALPLLRICQILRIWLQHKKAS
jgi:hypothetical protein